MLYVKGFFVLMIFLASNVIGHRGPSNKPVSTDRPFFGSITHNLKPTKQWGSFTTPLPTGSHWTNFVLGDGNQPGTPIPYVVRARADGLVVGFPFITTSQPVVFGSVSDDILISAAEVNSRRIVDFDSLSVTVGFRGGTQRSERARRSDFGSLTQGISTNRWDQNVPLCKVSPPVTPPPVSPPSTAPVTPPVSPPVTPPVSPPVTSPVEPPTSVGPEKGVITGIPNNELTVHIVDGHPYITAKYGSVTPIIGSPNAIMTVNGKSDRTSYTGNKWVVAINNGRTYIIYSLSGDLTLNWSGNQLRAPGKWTGVLRIAIRPNAQHESMLDQYKGTYPIAAKIDYTVANDVADMKFSYITEGGSASNLLMLALPHHVDSLVNPNYVNNVPAYRVLKGTMRPVVGNVWTIREPLTKISWNSPRPIDSSKVDAIKASVREDLGNAPAAPGDTYTFGKVVARYTRLALIADEVGDTSSRNEYINRAKQMMNPWITQTHAFNNLKYDSTWGGIISTIGRNDAGAEYGQGWYNDHHFHWGYYVYAAAVIAKFDSAWGNANKAAINDLVRDYANPYPEDKYFPVARHKDFFAGHSWASGLFEFGDAKNQESTSESVNGYYAVYLWGLATGNNDIKDWGRLLLATEIRSSKKYWQMNPNDKSIYESPFVDQFCVGILWGTKVDYATWFGLNVEWIHGIQFLPFTPITEELLPKSWIEVEYPLLSTSLTRTNPVIEEGWKGFVYLARSIIDKNGAWNQINNLRGYDNGNSKTNTMYFMATRP